MSKIKKFFLDADEEEFINLALLRLAKKLPAHEFFYKINQINAFKFKRIKDIIITGKYFQYNFPRFEAYHDSSKNYLQIIGNKSEISYKIKEQKELFNTENETSYLFKEFLDVDYVFKSADFIDDFSLILLPENLAFNLQTISLISNDDRYQLIKYYE